MPPTESPGFRLTPQRAAVLDVVRRSRDHPSAREILSRVRREQPGIGFATVYRALGVLAAHGQILELNLGDGAVARYDGNTRLHDHVICVSCGAAADVAVELPEQAANRAAAASGFVITGYELQFRGHCPACAATSAPA